MTPRFREGMSAAARVTVTPAVAAGFAELSGDSNPIHLDADAARAFGHPQPVAHGAFLLAVVSRLIGTELPGRGTNWLKQKISISGHAGVGETLTATLRVVRVRPEKGLVNLSTTCTGASGRIVWEGEALVGRSRIQRPDGETRVSFRHELIDGGRRLRSVEQLRGGGQEQDNTWIFDR